MKNLTHFRTRDLDNLPRRVKVTRPTYGARVRPSERSVIVRDDTRLSAKRVGAEVVR